MSMQIRPQALCVAVILAAAACGPLPEDPLTGDATAEVQAECNGLLDYTRSGDDPNVFNITDGLRRQFDSAFGIERSEGVGEDYDNFGREPGGLDVNDHNGSYRRLLNAILLLKWPRADGAGPGTWYRRAADNIASIEPITDCDLRGEATWGVNTLFDGQRHVDISRTMLRATNVISRAATLVHEARHADEPHLCNTDCDVCQDGGSCDTSWSQGDSDQAGANTDAVKFIIEASRLEDRFSSQVLEDARVRANAILNYRYKYHPGFQLSDPTGKNDRIGNFVRVSWDTVSQHSDGQLEVAYMPDPDDAVFAITGLGLRAHADHDEPRDIGVMTTMQICRRQVFDDGHLGPQRCFRRGRLPDNGLERFVDLSAVVGADNLVATGVIVREAAYNIRTLCLRARPLYESGRLGPEQVHCAAGSNRRYVEQDFSVPERHFLTGLGFEVHSGSVREWAYTAKAPSWTQTAGGAGGTSKLLWCGDDKVAIGSVQSAVGRGRLVGQFGLICASRASVSAGVIPPVSARTVIHGSVAGGSGSSYRAQLQTLSAYRRRKPGGVRETYCRAGRAITGVHVRGGALIDRIDSLSCGSISWAGGYDEEFVSVGVGGSGGRYQALSCGGRTVSGLMIRSGGSTDAIALSCAPSAPPSSVRWTPYAGGRGGSGDALWCKSGGVAIGTVQSSSGDTVGQFGLVCAPRQLVGNRGLATSHLSVVVGGFAYDQPDRDPLPAWPSGWMRYSTYLSERPVGSTISRCPAGYILDRISLRAGLLIDRIDRLHCKRGSRVRRVRVGVGGHGGSSATLGCGDASIDGLYIRSEASTHGVSFHCDGPTSSRGGQEG